MSAALLPPLLALTAGIALGEIYFAALRRGISHWLAGRQGPTLALAAGRAAGIGGALWVAAQFGAPPVLAMLAGFLIGRQRRLVRREAPP